jgi:hypothetical protein
MRTSSVWTHGPISMRSTQMVLFCRREWQREERWWGPVAHRRLSRRCRVRNAYELINVGQMSPSVRCDGAQSLRVLSSWPMWTHPMPSETEMNLFPEKSHRGWSRH